jgi:hypothetical protein
MGVQVIVAGTLLLYRYPAVVIAYGHRFNGLMDSDKNDLVIEDNIK